MNKMRGLGKGLSSLIPNTESEFDQPIFLCPLDLLIPNQEQPRKTKDEELPYLSDSIEENGMLQPILVKKKGEKYLIIAGERRWRAAKLKNMERVPVIIHEVSDEKILELALIENIQRKNLNCIEEARAYLKLQERFQLTHEELAKKMGKDRTSVTNMLRLLSLPEVIREDLEHEIITVGHGKALLGLKDEKEILRAYQILKEKGLSVRQTEMLVQAMKNTKTESVQKLPKLKDDSLLYREQVLSALLSTKVTIQEGKNRGQGKIIIHFDSLEVLDSLCLRMEGGPWKRD